MPPKHRFNSPANGQVQGYGNQTSTAESMLPNVRQLQQEMSAQVEEYPLTAVCAAFGIGLLAGASAIALTCGLRSTPTHQPAKLMHRIGDSQMVQRISDAVRSALSFS